MSPQLLVVIRLDYFGGFYYDDASNTYVPFIRIRRSAIGRLLRTIIAITRKCSMNRAPVSRGFVVNTTAKHLGVLYVPADYDLLTRDITYLATRFGRYDYRRITALLKDLGWHCVDQPEINAPMAGC